MCPVGVICGGITLRRAVSTGARSCYSRSHAVAYAHPVPCASYLHPFRGPGLAASRLGGASSPTAPSRYVTLVREDGVRLTRSLHPFATRFGEGEQEGLRGSGSGHSRANPLSGGTLLDMFTAPVVLPPNAHEGDRAEEESLEGPAHPEDLSAPTEQETEAVALQQATDIGSRQPFTSVAAATADLQNYKERMKVLFGSYTQGVSTVTQKVERTREEALRTLDDRFDNRA